MKIIWSPTRKCNLACEHCFLDETLNKEDTLSFAEVTRIFKEFTQKQEWSKVEITGGEFFRRSDAVDIIHALNFSGLELGVATNGTFYDKIYLSIKSLLDPDKIFFSISLDGPE